MSPKIFRLLTAAGLLCGASQVQAAIICANPTSPGFATAYAQTGVVPNVTQTSVTVSCTRTAADSSVVYLRGSNSNNCGGAGNTDAIFGGKCIDYEVYSDSSCTTVWSRGGPGSITVNLPLLFPTANIVTVPLWGCITLAGQNPAAVAGPYLGSTPALIKANAGGGGGATYGTGSVSASITFLATCSITSITPVAFGTYVAFRSTPLTSTGGVPTLTCTTNLPYTMAVSPTSGVLVGLNYTLAMSAINGRGGLAPPTIVGTMPANQAGTCTTGSCSGSNTHTLTVTY